MQSLIDFLQFLKFSISGFVVGSVSLLVIIAVCFFGFRLVRNFIRGLKKLSDNPCDRCAIHHSCGSPTNSGCRYWRSF